jgi:uncharacterized protein YndB with AHSA1/START domain
VPVFTGHHVGSCDLDRAQVFHAATQPDLLDRWTVGQFENVRPQDGMPLGAGSRFRADAVLAEGAGDMDHLYEVFRYEPPSAFALRCIDGPHYVGELELTAQGERTQISWTFSAAPSNLFDRVVSTLLYSRTRRETQRQAEREVGRLVAIAQDLSGR